MTFRASLLPLAALLATAVPCEALDLTGTWVGKQTCRGFDGQNFSFKLSESTVEILQTGSDVALQVLTDAEPDVYRGVAIDDSGNSAQGGVYFVHCGTSDVPGNGVDNFDETGILSARTKSNGSGKLKGASNYFNTAPEFAGCKWSYKRISTMPPVVGSCDLM
jgi:hypothetical protein